MHLLTMDKYALIYCEAGTCNAMLFDAAIKWI